MCMSFCWCVCVCVHVCVYEHVCVCVYVLCVYVCMRVYMHGKWTVGAFEFLQEQIRIAGHGLNKGHLVRDVCV